jgi:hypothetical protein
MRLMEGMRLRVKDVDFARGQVIVRGGKGDKDREGVGPGEWRVDISCAQSTAGNPLLFASQRQLVYPFAGSDACQ